jgi:hypothetical protein
MKKIYYLAILSSIVLINSNCSNLNFVDSKSNLLLDFRDFDEKDKEYEYIQINIPKKFKKEKHINDAFCEYRFTDKDKSVLYVSSDIYRGSKLNYENLYRIGINSYYPIKTNISDTIKNQGKDSKDLYWLEYVLGDVVIGYVNVDEKSKSKYDSIVSSLKKINKTNVKK